MSEGVAQVSVLQGPTLGVRLREVAVGVAAKRAGVCGECGGWGGTSFRVRRWGGAEIVGDEEKRWGRYG